MFLLNNNFQRQERKCVAKETADTQRKEGFTASVTMQLRFLMPLALGPQGLTKASPWDCSDTKILVDASRSSDHISCQFISIQEIWYVSWITSLVANPEGTESSVLQLYFICGRSFNHSHNVVENVEAIVWSKVDLAKNLKRCILGVTVPWKIMVVFHIHQNSFKQSSKI